MVPTLAVLACLAFTALATWAAWAVARRRHDRKFRILSAKMARRQKRAEIEVLRARREVARLKVELEESHRREAAAARCLRQLSYDEWTRTDFGIYEHTTSDKPVRADQV